MGVVLTYILACTITVIGFTICFLSCLRCVFRCVTTELRDVKYMDDVFYIISVGRVFFPRRYPTDIEDR